MITLLVGGVALLAVAGVIQLWTGRLTAATPARKELFWDSSGVFTGEDQVGVREMVTDPDKASNLLIATCELLVMTMAGFLLVYIVGTGGLPTYAVAVLAVTYLLGAYLVGRAVYLRLGLGEGSTGHSSSLHIEAALANQFGGDAEEDFAALSGALDTARGAENDPVTAIVLSGVRNGATPAELREVCSEAGTGSPEAVQERIETLTEGGLLVPGDDDEPLAFTDERLQDADPEQAAAVATSVAS